MKIICAISLCLIVSQSQGEDMESCLRSLPQVKLVTSYDVTNASCILIHMRQEHPDPLRFWDTKTGWWPTFRGIRDDIFVVGTNLQSRFNVNSYYLEGYARDRVDSVKDELRAGHAQFESDQIDRKRDEDDRREAEKQLATLLVQTKTQTNADQARMIQFYQHFLAFPVRSRFGENVMDMNDGLFLAVEANMTPRITENTESLNRGMAESKKVASGTDTIGSAEWNRVVLHDRKKEFCKPSLPIIQTASSQTGAYCLYLGVCMTSQKVSVNGIPRTPLSSR